MVVTALRPEAGAARSPRQRRHGVTRGASWEHLPRVESSLKRGRLAPLQRVGSRGCSCSLHHLGVAAARARRSASAPRLLALTVSRGDPLASSRAGIGARTSSAR